MGSIKDRIQKSKDSGKTTRLNKDILKLKESDGFFTSTAKKMSVISKVVLKNSDDGLKKKISTLELPTNLQSILEGDGISANLQILKLLFGKNGLAQLSSSKIRLFNKDHNNLKKCLKEIISIYRAVKLEAKFEAMNEIQSHFFETEFNKHLLKIENAIKAINSHFDRYRNGENDGKLKNLMNTLEKEFTRLKKSLQGGDLEDFSKNIPTYMVFVRKIKEFSSKVNDIHFDSHPLSRRCPFDNFRLIFDELDRFSDCLKEYFTTAKKAKIKLDGNFSELKNFLSKAKIKCSQFSINFLVKQSEKFENCDNEIEFKKSIEYQNALLCNIILWLSLPKDSVVNEEAIVEANNELENFEDHIDAEKIELQKVEEQKSGKSITDKSQQFNEQETKVNEKQK